MGEKEKEPASSAGKDSRSAEKKAPEGTDCGIPNLCRRTVPGWLVALDNIPTICLFALGGLIIWFFKWYFAVIFLAYCALSIVMFWGLICPYCHHFKTRACPCGYGIVASKFFRSRLAKGKTGFRRVFRRNIAIMFPCWVAPLVAGLYLLWTAYTPLTLAFFVAFCIDGFALIPAISVLVGCKDCEIKDDCPWMTRKRQN
jgi:hypothetical protein